MNGLLLLYQFFLVLFGAGYLLVRGVRGRGVPGWRERLGWYPQDGQRPLLSSQQPIWLHLVSVGEAVAARPLVEALRSRFPGRPWVITTVTPTGRSVAKGLLQGPQDRLLYLPWDLTPVVRRAIREMEPALFISFETELWPVLFHRLAEAGVPIFVVNGRISPAAYRRYLLVRPFLRRTLEKVDCFLTQSPEDGRRYERLGAPKERIAVTGNLKWDLALPEEGPAPPAEGVGEFPGLSKGALLWTAASTHAGEERQILQVYLSVKRQFPGLRLLIAPRHPERAGEVEREVNSAGLRAVRRTRGRAPLGVKGTRSDPVLLLDTLGELAAFYRLSDLVFVGGSLVPHGGHNLIEPAALAKPILTGPHLQNFQQVAESLLEAGGIVRVSSADELEERMKAFLSSPAARKELGQRAFSVIRRHRGATARTVEMILERWRPPKRRRGSPLSLERGFFLSLLLAALSVGYRLILAGIAAGFRFRILKVHRLAVPVVSVGNLTWGGTGKTPLVMHLARTLRAQGRHPAVLTRGYGADEARMLAERLAPIPVLAAPDRAASGNRAVRELGADILLLDDGYQQWRVKKDLEILLLDATAPFGSGWLLPWGNLREPPGAARRADLIIVTKAEMNPQGLEQVEARIRRFNRQAPLFFARYRPAGIWEWPGGRKVALGKMNGGGICTLAGIAHPESFEATVKSVGATIALKMRVADHHPYTAGQMIRLFDRCRRHGIRRIITTAKDAVRIPRTLAEPAGAALSGLELLVLEVELEFSPDESELLHRIDTLLSR